MLVRCVYYVAVCTQCVWSLLFTPTVEIGQGRLRGLRSVFGVNRYYGIPYAVADRFQLPVDPPKWNGTLNAVNPLVNCAQNLLNIPVGIENCLQLDVYSPDSAKEHDNLPVMVFIHGGAFYYGSKAHYDPEYLVNKDVVAVIINYRLGVFGFLCMGDVANLGLKDHIAALKWVKKNIAAFGGDPDNVTIAGQSAGAAAAGMHILSKSSKGLFHKVYLMSGTPLSLWAFNVDYIISTFDDARKLSPVNSEEEILKVFTNASIFDLLLITRDVSTDTRYFKYTPCVDKTNPDPFFHDAPYNIITSGDFNKVPLMMGFTNNEGIAFYGLSDDFTFDNLNKNFTGRLPSIFSWCSERDRQLIARKIRSHYFQKGTIDKSVVENIVNYFSDMIAYSAGNAFSELIAKMSDQPVYNYVFSYEGDRNFFKFISRTGLKGASHIDDLFYVFKPIGIPLLLSKEDKLIIERYTTSIANFMKYGNPTPSKSALLPIRWPASSCQALRLDSLLSFVDCCTRGQFLLSLMCRHGLPGFVPCKSDAQCTPVEL